jgi:hypothetical protein
MGLGSNSDRTAPLPARGTPCGMWSRSREWHAVRIPGTGFGDAFLGTPGVNLNERHRWPADWVAHGQGGRYARPGR